MLRFSILRPAIAEHLELVELVNAQDALGVLAVASRFTAVAGRPTGITGRGRQIIQDFIAVVAGKCNLAGAG